MVKRYGFDDDGITWGPNTDGAFVSAHEYDALAARLAEALKTLDAIDEEGDDYYYDIREPKNRLSGGGTWSGSSPSRAQR